MSIAVVQSLGQVQLFATPQTAGHQATLSFTMSQGLLQFMSTEQVMLSNHFILYHPLLLWLSILPSIRGFSNESAHRIGGQSIGASASASVLPMKYSGLNSFRIDWFDLLEIQETLKSLLQHHNLKASNVQDCKCLELLKATSPQIQEVGHSQDSRCSPNTTSASYTSQSFLSLGWGHVDYIWLQLIPGQGS